MSRPFDATLKGMLEGGPADWPALVGYPGRRVDVIDADVSTVSAASDKVLRVHDDPAWLLDVNFQSGPDASLPRRIHLYGALLEERHGLLVRSVAVLLTPRAELSTINGVHRCAFPGQPPYRTFHYEVVRVWQLSADELLAGGLGTLPLAPISDVTEEQLPDVLERMKRRLKQVRPAVRSQELWTAAYVLMGLRYERELVARLLRGVIAMEESVTYQAIIEEGMARGLSQGEARGRREEARRMILSLGTRQFGPPTAEVQAALEAIDDLEALEQLLLRVLDVSAWQELLPPPRRRPGRRRPRS